jgi:hypothetical protein
MLDTWNDGATKAAIVDFVQRVTTEGGSDYVEPASRVAVFDNDGTLWCEKPAYIQLDFLVRRLAEQASADASLREKQPYKAAADGDLKWFGDAITKHYEGDDSDIKVLGVAVLSANVAISTEEHAARVDAFFAEAKHPTLGRPYTACGYVPMVELLRYPEANGFACYIVSGGGRSLAAGNSNGDIQMLEYADAGTGPSLSMLVLHDDAEREFDYTAGAEKALEQAAESGWTVASIKNDWASVFSD